jgi:hypothetical protein
VAFAYIVLHFVPSIYWGARGDSIVAPLLWSLLGAAYSAFEKWRSRHADLVSASEWMTGRRSTLLLSAALAGLLTSGVLNLVAYLIGRVAASSSEPMKAVEAIVFGYLIAGLHHVVCALRRPTIRQPAYIRQRSSSVGLVVVGGLGWAWASIFNLRWGRGPVLRDAVFDFVLFGAMTCGLLLI